MRGQVCSSTGLRGASWQVTGLWNSPRPVGPEEQHAWTRKGPKKVHINTEESSLLHRSHLRTPILFSIYGFHTYKTQQ